MQTRIFPIKEYNYSGVGGSTKKSPKVFVWGFNMFNNKVNTKTIAFFAVGR